MAKKKYITIAKKYAELVQEIAPVNKVVLFGSCARGTNREGSDIDIAVIVEKIEGDFLVLAAKLVKLGWEIDSKIEPVLLEEGKDESGFYESIMKEGIVAYTNKKKIA